MIRLLSCLLIKNYTEFGNQSVRRAYGKLTGVVGICLNVLLFAGKYLAGFLSGSVSVMADAFNNLSDAGSSFITLLGFYFAGKKPDKEHPFGHGRIEYVSGLAVSAIIMLMGFELLKTSILKLIHPEALEISAVTVGILTASILVKVYMAWYNRYYGNIINSTAMKAASTDSLSDCIATFVVLLSMLLYWIFEINVDGLSGIVVAAFILFAGYSSAKETISPLLGEAPDKEFVDSIEEIVMLHDMVSGVHDIVVHNYGPGRIMISLHAEVPGTENIYHIHDEIELIERELKQEFECEAVIHMDPIATDNERVMALRQEVSELVKSSYSELSIHDFRMVEGMDYANLIFDVVVPQGYFMTDTEVGDKISQLIENRWQEENYHAVVKVEKRYI